MSRVSSVGDGYRKCITLDDAYVEVSKCGSRAREENVAFQTLQAREQTRVKMAGLSIHSRSLRCPFQYHPGLRHRGTILRMFALDALRCIAVRRDKPSACATDLR